MGYTFPQTFISAVKGCSSGLLLPQNDYHETPKQREKLLWSYFLYDFPHHLSNDILGNIKLCSADLLCMAAVCHGLHHQLIESDLSVKKKT